MEPPKFSDQSNSIENTNYEQLIQDGILAVKNGNKELAAKLFEQAAMIDETDVRIWIWMSATTEDLEERREYLEHAVALDPSNSTAKRGLMLVTSKLEESRVKPQATPKPAQEPPPIKEAITKTYLCPNCGATISYSSEESAVVCQFCGFTRKVDQQVVVESKDQSLDQALPTERAHRWIEGQEKVTCEQCGAVVILPPGQTADSCPYCAANRFVTPTSIVEMVDPQLIGEFKIDPLSASDGIKAWLSKGWLSPDNLAAEHAGMQLHPAYYPFWLFEGTLEIPWFGDVNMGSGRIAQWEAHGGSHFENFKNVLVSGLRKLPPIELAGIEPFNLDELVDFSPDILAGWMALTYDYPLSDASLKAREKVINKVRLSLESEVEPTHQKRNFSTGEGKWSGLTYKLALLPIYTGHYIFRGQHYRLLVNGQTGKVSGKKPVDRIKLAMMAVAGVVLILVIIVVLLLIGRAISG